MDLDLSDKDLAFQAEVRAGVGEALTPELREAGQAGHQCLCRRSP